MNENISNNSSNQPEKPKTFSDQCRIWFRGFGETCSRFLLKIGLTANTVTIIGCAGHIIAAYLVAMGHFTWAGILLVFFAVTDFFDGTMARLSTEGKGTRFGAVLDSCTDRYAEFFIFGGLIYYYAVHEDYLTMMVAYIAIMGSILVSYTRKRRNRTIGYEARYHVTTGTLSFLGSLSVVAHPVYCHVGDSDRISYHGDPAHSIYAERIERKLDQQKSQAVGTIGILFIWVCDRAVSYSLL